AEPTPRPRARCSTAMRPIWPLCSKRAVPTGSPSSTASQCAAASSAPSHSSASGTDCSSMNTRRRISASAAASRAHSAGRISIVIDEYQASLVGQCGEQLGDGSGFQHIGVDANSGLRTKLLRERGALVATDKHFPVDEQLYAIGILHEYKAPAMVAQHRNAAAL